MQPITIEVPAEYIGVLKLFTGKADERQPYRNSIALEVGPKESRLVTTDGQRLGVFRLVSEQPTVEIPFTVIIPINLMEHVKRSKGLVRITTSLQDITVEQDALIVRGEPIDGTYPDWRKILPKGEVSGKAAQFNPAYIGDLAKAAAILHGSDWALKACVSVSHNGDGPAVICLGQVDFAGLIMPRKIAAPYKLPSWAFDKPQEETVRERIARTKAA